MTTETKEPLFRDIDGDEGENVNTIESLCMSCEENGTTRLLLTRIPFFKEIILMSFECPHCGFTNNEVQSAGRIQEKGCTITLSVSSPKDLNRQVVKSDAASFTIPELEFESPAFSQKGELNTIEGLLERAITGLEEHQPVRKIVDPVLAAKIDEIVSQLKKCHDGKMNFTLILDDVSGNSFIENPHAPKDDPCMTFLQYMRSTKQDASLGLQSASEAATEENTAEKEAGIEPKGCRLTLKITDPEDLNRDVLKSETCEVQIPSLDFVTHAGTLGGRFTTLEGLLTNIKEQLQSVNPFGFGDSPALFNSQMKTFLTGIDKIISGEELGVEIILDDPAGNSYIQNLYAPDPDPELEVFHYQRSKEQDDDLGISDMKTEGYEEDEKS
ncbi:nucleolar zinc-finger protein [Porites harrisoni]